MHSKILTGNNKWNNNLNIMLKIEIWIIMANNMIKHLSLSIWIKEAKHH